jgi:apolipoprotein N-acyltransferase
MRVTFFMELSHKINSNFIKIYRVLKLNTFYCFTLSILSGILMMISFPFSGSLTALVFISWVPLLFIEDFIESGKKKSILVFLYAFLSFFIYNIGTTWWVCNASFGGGAAAIIANTILMTCTFQAFHFAKKHIGRKQGYLSVPFLWIGFEYLHFNWDISWPWLTLGNVFSIRTSWIQWYEFTGVHGGTLWILILNILIFRCLTQYLNNGKKFLPLTKQFFVIGFFIIIPLISSLLIKFNGGPSGKDVKDYKVVIIQANIDPYNEKFAINSSVESQLEKHFKLAELKYSEDIDLLLSPETAISSGFRESNIINEAFFKYLDLKSKRWGNTDFLLGASTYEIFREKKSKASFPLPNGGFYENYNSSILLTADKKIEFIHKSKLVPGAEIIPFSKYLPFLEDLALDNGGTSGTLGIEDSPKIYKTKKALLAPVICYESIYGDFTSKQVRQGAELICILTNDGWWGDTPGYKQHFSFARLRAIESRRWVVRSANTGTSGVINEYGEVIEQTPYWKPAVISKTVPLLKSQTIYSQQGDYIGRSFAFVAVLIVLFAISKKIKSKFS